MPISETVEYLYYANKLIVSISSGGIARYWNPESGALFREVRQLEINISSRLILGLHIEPIFIDRLRAIVLQKHYHLRKEQRKRRKRFSHFPRTKATL